MGQLNLQSPAARTGLTKEQKRQAEAAIYGLPNYVPSRQYDEQRLTLEQLAQRETEAEELRRIYRKLQGANV